MPNQADHASLLRLIEDGPWVVYSHEHRSWWMGRNQGYWPTLFGAGIYTEAAAKEIEEGANRGGERHEEAMSLDDALAREALKVGRHDPHVVHLYRVSLPESAGVDTTEETRNG